MISTFFKFIRGFDEVDIDPHLESGNTCATKGHKKLRVRKNVRKLLFIAIE